MTDKKNDPKDAKPLTVDKPEKAPVDTPAEKLTADDLPPVGAAPAWGGSPQDSFDTED